MIKKLSALATLCVLIGCQTFTSTDPKTAILYMDLGMKHLAQGQKQDALSSFLKAEKLDSSNKEIQNQLGLTYFLFKKYNVSAKYFRKSLSIDSEYTEARNNLARALLEQGQVGAARKELNMVFADLTYKNLANAYMNLGLSYFKEGNYREAIVNLEKALRENRNSCYAMTMYARCYYELKDYKKAVSLFDTAMPMCQKVNYDEAHYFGALAYFKSGQRTKGIALMNETILIYNKGDYEMKSREMLELMKLNRL
ncbi:MAG: tetratricopeptide repeat protein [Bdellovibrionaceae bacterium]|nr:tetratricopeptide repeat protein [Pseudobdellovibrionaceae bacterium]